MGSSAISKEMQKALQDLFSWPSRYKTRVSETLLRVSVEARRIRGFLDITEQEEATDALNESADFLSDELFQSLRALQRTSEILRDEVGTLEASLLEARDLNQAIHQEYSAKLCEAIAVATDLKAARERRLQEHATYSPELRARVLALTDGKCAYCCIPISDSDDGTEGFEVEHVVAKDNGGPDHFANYVPSCRPCNSKKRTSHVLEFIHFRLGIAHPEPLVSVSEETPVSIDVVTRSDEFLEAAE